jgi:hypothetical protein
MAAHSPSGGRAHRWGASRVAPPFRAAARRLVCSSPPHALVCFRPGERTKWGLGFGAARSAIVLFSRYLRTAVGWWSMAHGNRAHFRPRWACICRPKPLRLWTRVNFSVGLMNSKSKKRKIMLSWVGPFSVSRVNKQCWTEPSSVAGPGRRPGPVS